MAFLWTVPIIYLVNIKIHFHFSVMLPIVQNLLQLMTYFIVSNLIGNHIFLWLEPRNSIAHQQTLVQGLGKSSTSIYVLPVQLIT